MLHFRTRKRIEKRLRTNLREVKTTKAERVRKALLKKKKSSSLALKGAQVLRNMRGFCGARFGSVFVGRFPALSGKRPNGW